MGIKVSCPHCDESYTVSDAKEGRTVRCRNCDEKIVVGRGRRSARDEDDYEEDDRPRRRSRSGGIPAWAWILGGGGVAVVFVVVLLLALTGKGDKDKGGSGGPGSFGRAGGPGVPPRTPSVPVGGQSRPVTPSVETFARIKHGMTEKDVVAIFGPPTSREKRGMGGLTAVALIWERPTQPRLFVVLDFRGQVAQATLTSGGGILADLPFSAQ